MMMVVVMMMMMVIRGGRGALVLSEDEFARLVGGRGLGRVQPLQGVGDGFEKIGVAHGGRRRLGPLPRLGQSRRRGEGGGREHVGGGVAIHGYLLVFHPPAVTRQTFLWLLCHKPEASAVVSQRKSVDGAVVFLGFDEAEGALGR